MNSYTRRSAIVHLGAIAVGGNVLAEHIGGGRQRSAADPIDRDTVKKFVAAAHGDLALVRSMLDDEPHLINATWDWGAGDFETALGGASHMARPDIANLLLMKGARMDLFCATMLGKLDVVRACVADNPEIVHVRGPHGITLLRHAELAKQDVIAKLLVAAGA